MQSNVDMYPSRIGGQERIVDRLDPVVYSPPSSKGPLNEEQLDFYNTNGYLLLPDYLPDLVDPLINEIQNLRHRMRGRDEWVVEPDSDALRTIFKPFAYSSLIEQFFRLPEILDVVQQMLGSHAYMMQSRLNVKPAYKGKSFAWHSDFETWHVEDGMPRMRAVTAWIMLTENTEHNGPLYVIPGSHWNYVSCAGRTGKDNHKSSLRKQVLGVPQAQTMDRILSERNVESITGSPGTVVFHECNLLHGSPDNITNDSRMNLMCVYNSVENQPREPFGGLEPRPHYLSNRDTRAVSPAEYNRTELSQWFAQSKSA